MSPTFLWQLLQRRLWKIKEKPSIAGCVCCDADEHLINNVVQFTDKGYIQSASECPIFCFQYTCISSQMLPSVMHLENIWMQYQIGVWKNDMVIKNVAILRVARYFSAFWSYPRPHLMTVNLYTKNVCGLNSAKRSYGLDSYWNYRSNHNAESTFQLMDSINVGVRLNG